jgi:anti-sigma factor RsiW
MRSVLDEFSDRESSLLLYLADELSPADRAQLERMLASDPSLAAKLQALRLSQDSLDAALARVDAQHAVPGSASAAARQFGRAVRQWHADRLANIQIGDAKSLRFPWWSYPLATAAAITLAVVVWWQTFQAAPTQPGGESIASSLQQQQQQQQLESMMQQDDTEAPERFATLTLDSLQDSGALGKMEREMQAIQELREMQ